MPSSVVKTAADERLWSQAKLRADQEGHGDNHAFVLGLYQRMKAGTIRKAFVTRYGAPTSSTGGDWIREVAESSGVPAGVLYQSYRRGLERGTYAVPGPVAARVCVYADAINKAQRAPRGYTPIPKGKSAGYRKRVGGKWVYWYPRRIPVIAPFAGRPELRADAHPQDISPEQVGAVHQSMSRDEVEATIKGEPLEHLVVFHAGRQVYRAVGTENQVTLDTEAVAKWRELDTCVLTHNHPSGTSLSLEDILTCVGADLEEIRAVSPSGGVFTMTRPEKGWGKPGGLTGTEVSGFLIGARARALYHARKEMDFIVRMAGGDPADGTGATGYDNDAWNRLQSGHLEREFNRQFRIEGLGWEIEHYGDRYHPVGARDARQESPSSVPASARKGGLRGVVDLAARLAGRAHLVSPDELPPFAALIRKALEKPPQGYTPIPRGKRGGYRKWSGGKWVYWYPGRAITPQPRDEEPQLDLFANNPPPAPRAPATEVSPDAKPGPRVPIYYASGSSPAHDLRAFARIGHPVGVVVSELNEDSFAALEDTVEPAGVQVFLDSGAFAEFGSFDEKTGVHTPGEEITDEDWEQRLDRYERVARILGPRLVLVAPDKIADQQETLRRMRKFRERVLGLTSWGSRVLVPLQGGDLSLTEFSYQAYEALGVTLETDGDVYVPSFPMKKNPVPVTQIEEFLRVRQPARVHFLGLGPRSRKRDAETGRKTLDAVQQAVEEYSPHTIVSLDSVLLRSQAGYTGGQEPGGGTKRRMTAATIAAARRIAELAGPQLQEVGEVPVLLPGYGEAVDNAMGAPHLAFSRSQLRGIGKRAGLPKEEVSKWAREPHHYRAPNNDLDSALTRELQAKAVEVYQTEPTTGIRREAAVRAAFAGRQVPRSVQEYEGRMAELAGRLGLASEGGQHRDGLGGETRIVVQRDPAALRAALGPLDSKQDQRKVKRFVARVAGEIERVHALEDPLLPLPPGKLPVWRKEDRQEIVDSIQGRAKGRQGTHLVAAALDELEHGYLTVDLTPEERPYRFAQLEGSVRALELLVEEFDKSLTKAVDQFSLFAAGDKSEKEAPKKMRSPPPGFSATPGSKIGSYRKRVGGQWTYWKPGDPALHARFGEQAAPKFGEKGHRAPPERGEALDGRSPVEIASTAFDVAYRLLDDPDLYSILDPEWIAEWKEDWDPTDDVWQEREELIELGELAYWLQIPFTGIRGDVATPEVRSDLAHEILELAMASKHGGAPVGWVADKYVHHGEIPTWAAKAVLADRLETTRKLRLVVVGKDRAARFIAKHHSELPYLNPRGLMYALGVKRGDRLVAVATAGHPTGQWGQSGRVESKNVLELTRVASDGTTLGASSKLVSRVLDLLDKSGRGDDPDAPKLFVTYQLTTESGTTYGALRQHPAGLRPVEFVRGTTPHGARSGGVEEDEALAELDKIRWEAGPAALPAKWGLVERSEQMGLFGKSLSFVLIKGGKPPKGFTPIPRGRKGGYRKRVGNRWIYWYPADPRQQDMFVAEKPAARLPERVEDWKDVSQLRDLPLDSFERSIANTKVEHGAAFADGKQLWQATGTSESIAVPWDVVQEIREHGNVTFTHSHPSPYPLSGADIACAVAENQKEMRCVTPQGDVWKITRPKEGWGSFGTGSDSRRLFVFEEESAAMLQLGLGLSGNTLFWSYDEYHPGKRIAATPEDLDDASLAAMDEAEALWKGTGVYRGTGGLVSNLDLLGNDPLVQEFIGGGLAKHFELEKRLIAPIFGYIYAQRLQAAFKRLRLNITLEHEPAEAGRQLGTGRGFSALAAEDQRAFGDTLRAARRRLQFRERLGKARSFLEGLNSTPRGPSSTVTPGRRLYALLELPFPEDRPTVAETIPLVEQAIAQMEAADERGEVLEVSLPPEPPFTTWKKPIGDFTMTGMGFRQGQLTKELPNLWHPDNAELHGLYKSLRPPKGFAPIPGGKKGGYRKRVGNRWIYWYPRGGKQGQLSMFGAGDESDAPPSPRDKLPEYKAELAGWAEKERRRVVQTGSQDIWNKARLELWKEIRLHGFGNPDNETLDGETGLPASGWRQLPAWAPKAIRAYTERAVYLDQEIARLRRLRAGPEDALLFQPFSSWYFGELVRDMLELGTTLESGGFPTPAAAASAENTLRAQNARKLGVAAKFGSYDLLVDAIWPDSEPVSGEDPAAKKPRAEWGRAEAVERVEVLRKQHGERALFEQKRQHLLDYAKAKLKRYETAAVAWADPKGKSAGHIAIDADGLRWGGPADPGHPAAPLSNEVRLATMWRGLMDMDDGALDDKQLREFNQEVARRRESYEEQNVKGLQAVAELRAQTYEIDAEREREEERAKEAADKTLVEIGLRERLRAHVPDKDLDRVFAAAQRSLQEDIRDRSWRVDAEEALEAASLASSPQALGHWGSARSSNEVAVATARFGDHGVMRPLDEGMERHRVVFPGDKAMRRRRVGRYAVERTVHLREPKDVIEGMSRYVHAQEKMEQYSREEHPTLYRGLGLTNEVIEGLKPGSKIPLTGCTAFSFDESIGLHYTGSTWTQRKSASGARGVLFELERTEEFDATVAGWHPNKRDPKNLPAYEIVSGATHLEVVSMTVIPAEYPEVVRIKVRGVLRD